MSENGSHTAGWKIILPLALIILAVAAALWILATVRRFARQRHQEPAGTVSRPRIRAEVVAAGTLRRERPQPSSEELERRCPLMEYKEWKDQQLVKGNGDARRPDQNAIPGNETRPLDRHELKRRSISCPVLPLIGDNNPSRYTNKGRTEVVLLATEDNHTRRTRKAGTGNWQQDDRGYHSEDLLEGGEDALSKAEKGLGVTLPRLDENYNGCDLCAICLEELLDNDRIRSLVCNHTFHATCVDGWLLGHRANCPVCQGDCFSTQGA